MDTALTSESVADAPEKITVRLGLRPGTAVLSVSPDKLLIVFANHTVTFVGSPVTLGIQALIDLLQTGRERTELVSLAAEATGLGPAFVDYLVDLLLQNNCLYEQGSPLPDAWNGQSALAEFHASLGSDPAVALDSLAALRPLAVAPASVADELSETLSASGITAEVVSILPGTTLGEILGAMALSWERSPPLILSWNIPYRLPLAGYLNELSVERGVPLLFGTCEGVVGRIGPYVIPQNTACLECLNKRMLANAGTPESQAYAELRTRYSDSLPAPTPPHAVFRSIITGLFVLEVSRIALNHPPQTISGMVEYHYADGSAAHHTIFKVPRCKACHPPRPPRIPWNARFPAPVVKDGGE